MCRQAGIWLNELTLANFSCASKSVQSRSITAVSGFPNIHHMRITRFVWIYAPIFFFIFHRQFDTIYAHNTLITVIVYFLVIRNFLSLSLNTVKWKSIKIWQFYWKFYKWSFNECTNTLIHEHSSVLVACLGFLFFSVMVPFCLLLLFFSSTHSQNNKSIAWIVKFHKLNFLCHSFGFMNLIHNCFF